MGPVPLGHTIDHTCKQKRCVNPNHLRILTNYENARRTDGRDWPLGQCVNGHPNSELRDFANGDGKTKRRCRICYHGYQKKYQRKIKARLAAA
ncbi:HNH endonuclease [Arthrobacter phage MargaretKali]|nr:HNH endonuclease [Arthrobacter phage MargaretKali]AXH44432.1 HNH endonuclease [Arthrobacter phage MargaretKali]